MFDQRPRRFGTIYKSIYSDSMTQNVDLEIKVIERFVVKTKIDRYIQFVSSPKNRQKFILDLAHFKHFKWDLLSKVTGIETNVIFDTLHQNDISDKTCYVISENTNIDKSTIDIKEAIQEVVGYNMGTILVFGNADAIFYEGESAKTRFISKFLG